MVGDLLKKAREESGKDLKEISAVLKIRYEYLRAIEEGDFKNLPEEVYIKGYIREYAEFLHIDPETALSVYVQQTAPPTDAPGEPPTKVTSDDKKVKTTYILIPFILVIFGLLLFAVLHSPQEEIPQDSIETNEIMPPPLIEPPEEMPLLPAETKEEVPFLLPGTSQEVLTPHVDTITKTPSDSERAKQPVVKTITPQHTLKVVTTDTVWLLITADNADSQEMTLKPGETVTFQAHEGFSLKIGNAGGTKVVFNGKELGEIGEKGQVVTLDLPEKN